ncbi:MAG: hypothetical protein NVS2B7_17170 [Herpetosiphon sp.]
MQNVIDKQQNQSAFLPAQEALAAVSEFPMSLSTLTRLSAKGDFPAPVKIGGRSFWEAAAIAEWKSARIQEARIQSTKQSKE